MRRKVPRVRFLAVGPDDPAKDDAIGGDVIADASGDVTFAGFRTDMPEIFSMLDVFVLASWREGRAALRDRGGGDGHSARPDRHPRMQRGRP